MFLLGIVILSFVYVNYSLDAQCFGFFKDGVCYNIGDELRVDGEYFYVDNNGELIRQKSAGLSCNNNFECLDNLCSNGECVDLYAEVKDNKDLAEEISEVEISTEERYDLSISVVANKEVYPIGEVIKLK